MNQYKNDTHNFSLVLQGREPNNHINDSSETSVSTSQRKKNAIYDEDSIYKHELNACGIGFIRKHDWINQKRYPPNKPSRLWVYIPVKQIKKRNRVYKPKTKLLCIGSKILGQGDVARARPTLHCRVNNDDGNIKTLCNEAE